MTSTDLSRIQTPRIKLHPTTVHSLKSQNLIFFITGNPGLIHYYDTFLKTLHELLSTNRASPSSQFHIYGQSLAGFEDEDSPGAQTPWGLEEQIQILQKALERQQIPSGPRKDQPYDNIILIGHSVGTYIVLELLQRLRKCGSQLNLRAGILLFATVTHLAQSPNGVKASPLFRLHDFPRRASIVIGGFSWLITPVLKWLVGLVTGMPNDAAQVTTGFLRSRMGVWQALHLAEDEMKMITEDRWDEDLWGLEQKDLKQDASIPKLVFYFGQNDHWVADHTRDALIAARCQGPPSSKPLMIIDQDGIPHDFCIKHSEIVAEKVKVWIEEIAADFQPNSQ